MEYPSGWLLFNVDVADLKVEVAETENKVPEPVIGLWNKVPLKILNGIFL